jgi:hypothetical protein
MSQLVGGAQPQFILREDDQTTSEAFRARARARARLCCRRLDYQAGFWPRRGGFMGDAAVDVAMLDGVSWGTFYPAGGIASRLGFVGVTRDQYGTPTGNCVVQLFRTSDDLFIMEITSDASGNFLLQSIYTPDTHYIVAYKAGSPDIFGTTVNTLVGA